MILAKVKEEEEEPLPSYLFKVNAKTSSVKQFEGGAKHQIAPGASESAVA